MTKFIFITSLITLYSCVETHSPTRNRALTKEVPHQATATLQNPCIATLKEGMINRTISLQNESTPFDDQLVNHYRSFNSSKFINRNFELTKDNADQRDYKEIAVEFEYQGGESLGYSLSLSEDQLELNIKFSMENGPTEVSIEKSFNVNSKCELSFKELEILKEEDISSTEQKLSKSYYNLIDESLEDSKIVAQAQLDFGIGPKELFTILKSNPSIKKNGIYHFGFDETEIQSQFDFSLNAQSLEFHPISGATENFLNATWSIEDNFLGNLEILLTGNARNSYYTMEVPEFSSFSEFCDCSQYFLNAPLKSEQENKAAVQGLSAGDFYDSQSLLKVTTDYKDNMELLRNYFNVTEVTANDYSLALKTTQITTIDYPSQTLPIDQVYLEKSKFIDTNHPKIIEFKNEILSKNLAVRSDILKEVLKIVNREITYDDSQIDNDITRPLTLDEIFSKEKGVCQHYALVATALLRSLGIPTRIASGFLLDEDSAGGHAWIEVKLSNDAWTPVEPQNENDYFIWTFNYFPLGEMINYEEGNSLYSKNMAESGMMGFLKSFIFEKK